MNETTALLHLSRIDLLLTRVQQDVETMRKAANEFAAWLEKQKIELQMQDPRFYK